MEPRNYESGAAGAPPSEPVSPSTGYPTSGDPGQGTPATKPGPFWFYKMGESIRNVITSAGLSPSDSDLTLLQQAIVKITSQTNHVVRLDGVTFAAGVADGEAVYWDQANNRYDQALADGSSKQNVVGFADVTNSLVEAFGRSSLFSGLTAGSRYYLSGSTAGAITVTAPTNKVVVGQAKSATTLFIDIDPDGSVPTQDQSTWNTGTDTTESAISPAKLDAKIKTLTIGDGQTWQNVTGSRVAGTTYTNSTGKTIFVSIQAVVNANIAIVPWLVIDGVNASYAGGNGASANMGAYAFMPIPPGSTYKLNTVSGIGSPTNWSELR